MLIEKQAYLHTWQKGSILTYVYIWAYLHAVRACIYCSGVGYMGQGRDAATLSEKYSRPRVLNAPDYLPLAGAADQDIRT